MVRKRVAGGRSWARGVRARVCAGLTALGLLAWPAAAQQARQSRQAQQAQAPIVIRSAGHQYGFPDADDPSKLVWVFLDGVEVQQGTRRMLGETLVLVLRRSEETAHIPSASLPMVGGEDDSSFPNERILEFFLDGYVTLEEGDERLVGASSLHVDNTSGRMSVLDGLWQMDLQGQPFQVRFDLMRELGGGVRELEGMVYTTCEYAHEHWSLSTPWARLVPTPDGRVLHTGGNTAELGRVPLIWLPGIHLNVDRDRPPIRSVGFGTSSRLGTEVQTVWGASADEFLTGVSRLFGGSEPVEGEWEVELHNYSSRGLWVQPSWKYQSKSSSGRILSSYIRDDNARDSNDDPIVDTSRGRFDVEHRTRIDENRTVDLEISYESDEGFLDEYYPNENRTQKQQESYLSYRDVEDNRALSIIGRWRLNHFDTQTEYAPRVSHRVVGQPVELGFLGTAHLQHTAFVDNARLAVAEPEPGSAPPPGAADLDQRNQRAGSRARLSWDWDMGDGDRLELAGGWDVVAFADTIDQSSEVRRALLGGLTWSQTWSGTGDAQSELWNIDGVRQIIEPRIGYGTLGAVNLLPDELILIDETETLEPRTAFTVGLRHRIQTHQGDDLATLFDLDLSVPLFPNEDRDNVSAEAQQAYLTELAAGGDPERPQGETVGPARFQMLWKPGAHIWGLRRAQVRWRANVDTHGGGLLRSFTSYQNSWGEKGRLALSHDKVEDSSVRSNFAALGVLWELTPKWTVAYLRREDLLLNQKAYDALVFRQRAHRWLIDIELSQRRGQSNGTTDIPQENRVTLRARPTVFQDDDETLLDDLGRIRW